MKPTTPVELPLETLTALKDALPHGSIEIIAETTGISRQTIHNIFSGDAKITENNYKVIEKAQSILKQSKEEADKMNKDILKSLNQ